MKISRTLLSYAGTLGLVSITHVALGQTAAPAAPAAAQPAPAPAAAEPAPAPAAAADASVSTTSVGASAIVDPAPVALPPAPLPVVEPAPTAEPEAKADANPKKLAAAKQGWLQLGGLAQAWWVYDRADKLAVDADSGKPVSSDNYFRVRRAQLKLTAAIVPDSVEFMMIADFAKTLKTSTATITNADGTKTEIGKYYGAQDSSPLLDFVLTAKSEYADFSVGQWKSPISYEAGTSSAELLLPERSFSTRYFGDNYDLGIKAEKKLKYVKYSAQVLQGNSANTIDNNKQKELALRLEFYPLDGLYVGGAVLASVGQRDTQKATREVIEADLGYDKDGLTVRGEILWGWKGADKDGVERSKSRGINVSGGYTIAKMIQPAFRVSVLNVDETIDPAKPLPLDSKFGIKSDQVRAYEFGLNYLFEGKHAKLMASYGYFDFDGFEKVVYNPRHQVILGAQAAF